MSDSEVAKIGDNAVDVARTYSAMEGSGLTPKLAAHIRRTPGLRIKLVAMIDASLRITDVRHDSWGRPFTWGHAELNIQGYKAMLKQYGCDEDQVKVLMRTRLLRRKVHDAFEQLTMREGMMLATRFGIFGNQPCTFQQISHRYGLSQTHTRNIIRDAQLKTIRRVHDMSVRRT